MSLADVATIATKDLRLAWRRRSIKNALIAFPLITALGLPIVLHFAGHRTGGIPASALPALLSGFQFFFVIGAATLPTAIAAYALVGEKIERSLEPLLATPVRDVDVLLGKSIAAWIPAVAATMAGNVLFMVIADLETHAKLGYRYFPNAATLLVLLLLIPLVAALSVQMSVLVSARVSDVRSAQQIGALVSVPFLALYITVEIGAVTLDARSVALVALVLAALLVGLFFLARATFNREEILTRWR